MLWTRTFLLYSGTQFKVNFSRSSYNTNPHSKLSCGPHSKFACGGSTCILHSLVPLVLLTPSDPALRMVSENGIPTLGLKGAFRIQDWVDSTHPLGTIHLYQGEVLMYKSNPIMVLTYKSNSII